MRPLANRFRPVAYRKPEHRREFLRDALFAASALAGISACNPMATYCPDDEECASTPQNPEGPYYRAGAPERRDLNVLNRPGTPMRLSGRVFSGSCDTPVAGAVLDIWHADGDGIYDLDTQDYGLRGRVVTDDNGFWSVQTVLPGAYWFAGMARSRHVHFRIDAGNAGQLTTQLYFPNDEYHARDVQFVCGLVVDMEETNGQLDARYDFVLSPNAIG